jgi:hypothetical protein
VKCLTHTTLESGNGVLVDGQTLTQGGTLILASTTYILPTGSSIPVIIPPRTSGVVIGGLTLLPGSSIVVSGMTYVLPAGASIPGILVDGKTVFTGETAVVSGKTVVVPTVGTVNVLASGVLVNGEEAVTSGSILGSGGSVVASGFANSIPTGRKVSEFIGGSSMSRTTGRTGPTGSSIGPDSNRGQDSSGHRSLGLGFGMATFAALIVVFHLLRI